MTMIVLFLVAIVLFLLVVGAVFLSEKLSLENAAKKVIREQEIIHRGAHEYVSADLRDFPWLDAGFYDRVTGFLRQQGFLLLGDVENVTMTTAFPWGRTLIRNLVSPDGTVSVGVYYLRPRGTVGLLIRLLMRMKPQGYVDFETELRNTWNVKTPEGEVTEEERSFFLLTSNAEIAARVRLPPQFNARFLPVATPLETLLERHLERLEEARTKPGVRLVELRTLADTREMQNRMELLKAEFRKQVGLISREELRRIGGEEMEEQADRLYDAIQEEKTKQGRREEARSEGEG